MAFSSGLSGDTPVSWPPGLAGLLMFNTDTTPGGSHLMAYSTSPAGGLNFALGSLRPSSAPSRYDGGNRGRFADPFWGCICHADLHTGRERL